MYELLKMLSSAEYEMRILKHKFSNTKKVKSMDQNMSYKLSLNPN